MKKLFLSIAIVLAPLLVASGAEFTNITKAIAGDLRSTSANAYSLVQTNGTAVVRASLEQMRNRMLSEPVNGLNLTNLQGTNVVGFVQNATNAINATNLWGVAAQATHATNADSATYAEFATNLVAGASTTNLLLSGIGVADTNWVLQQISSLGSVHYLTGVTNTGSFTNSGETLPRTNNYITWLTVPTTVTTQSFGGLAVNAYIRHNVTTNTYAVISAGPASVSSYCYRTGAGTVSGHYEIYAYDTVSNVLYELASSSPVTIATGATPTRYDWQMTVPTSFVSTNATKMVIAFKLDQIGSGGPVLSFVNGGNYDAHFTFSRPLSSAVISPNQITPGAAGQVLTSDGSTTYWANAYRQVSVNVWGDECTFAGVKGNYITIPVGGTIQSCTLLAQPSGSITFHIWRTNNADASFPPTAVGSIGTNSLSSDNYAVDSTLTGWVKTLDAGDVLAFYLSAAATTITNATCVIKYQP